MTNNETRRYMMLVRVRDFGDAHREMFLRSDTAQRQLHALNIAVAELKALDVKKVSAAGQGRARRLAARNTLVAQLNAIAMTARAIAQEAPGVRDDFQMDVYKSDQGLITLGRSFADKARALEPQFLDNGMPESFLADPEAALLEMEQAAHQRATERRHHASARASIRAALRAGTAAARRLDAIVANQTRNDAVTLEIWQLDRHVDQRARRRLVPTPPSDAAPASTTVIDTPLVGRR